MDLPLRPTFANIFRCFHEMNWLNDCPSVFKPIFYKRYIDDTYLLFKSETHVKPMMEDPCFVRVEQDWHDQRPEDADLRPPAHYDDMCQQENVYEENNVYKNSI